MIHYITGGERSGKSSYAQTVALSLSSQPVYLATARVWDEDFSARIDRHKHDRDEYWRTIEQEKHVGALDLVGEVVVFDCVTLWLNNWFYDLANDLEAALTAASAELDMLFEKADQGKTTLIMISNELGMGGHAETAVGRKFTELQGWINQKIAQRADQAIMMVSGLPMKLK